MQKQRKYKTIDCTDVVQQKLVSHLDLDFKTGIANIPCEALPYPCTPFDVTVCAISFSSENLRIYCISPYLPKYQSLCYLNYNPA